MPAEPAFASGLQDSPFFARPAHEGITPNAQWQNLPTPGAVYSLGGNGPLAGSGQSVSGTVEAVRRDDG